jgi:hypothetical protein
MRPTIRLSSMPEVTNFAPLGVLGYCLTRSQFLPPVLQAVELPLKVVEHTAADKLLDLLVSILAGCRSITHTNIRIRPDLALACAWGRARFADQSTLSRTLDAFTSAHVAQLRDATSELFRQHSRTLQHPFEQDWLWLDIDLTPLPVSKRAEGATKGKISPKKTSMVVNWRVCRLRSITKRCFHASILVTNKVVRPICRSWWLLLRSWT